MKSISLLLLFPLLLFVSCNTIVDGDLNEEKNTGSGKLVELIKNGDVNNGSEGWGLYVQPPAEGEMLVNNGEIEFKIGNTGSDNWHIQGNYAGLTFVKGSSYILSIDLYSSMERDGQLRIQLDSDPYTAYLEEDIHVTTEKKTFKFEFIMEEETDEFAKLCFNFGTKVGNELESHNIFLDNLSILADTGEGDSSKIDNKIIAINQIGYNILGVKEVRISAPSDNFEVVSADTNEVVYSGTFADGINDAASGEIVYVGDFSEFKEQGRYFIKVQDYGITDLFEISNEVYTDLYESSLHMLYLARCGYDLSEETASHWAHEACHLSLATIYGTNKKIDVSGGWHDAGDYGRYVGPGAKAIADLIISGNLTPILLSEIKYELDWMLKMQDAETGGVYHKVTTSNFIGSVMPNENSDELIVSPISSTATGQFSAIMAMASRVFLSIDKSYSEKLIIASEKAWKWLEANPEYPGFVNPKGITTGEYGDPIDGDERYWASVELFLATGNSYYHEFAMDTYRGNGWDGLSWIDIGDYGTISYILSENKSKDSSFNSLLVKDFLNNANEYSVNTDNDGYGVSLDTYNWGSNGVVADNGLRLVVAYKISGDDKYLNNAERNLHYLLGSNSLGYSYVTGFGYKSVKHPHHRPTNATGQVMPGMLAGGPNEFLQDPLAKNKLNGVAPQKCYIDAEPSYSTNEITIYWNSAFYALLTAFVK